MYTKATLVRMPIKPQRKNHHDSSITRADIAIPTVARIAVVQYPTSSARCALRTRSRPDDQQSDDRSESPERPNHQRKQNPGNVVFTGRLEYGDTQNHGPDAFGGRGFEQVRATSGAVAHVVAHQVGDHRGVARVVLRQAGFPPLPTRSAPTSAALV